MDRLIFNANAAIRERAMDWRVLTNDLANISTVGFKRSMEVATKSIKAEGPGFEDRLQPQAKYADRVVLDPGQVMATGRPLDIALDGQTVLAVQARNNEAAFTRRGDLRVNVEGALETGAGHLVLGEAGPITIPPGFSVRINPDGTVVASNPAQAGVAAEQVVGQLRLRDASNVGLARREDGLLEVAEQPPGSDITNGTARPGVLSGALEGSNVSSVVALTRLMDHSRSFELQVRVIKQAKELDESGASMLKLG